MIEVEMPELVEPTDPAIHLFESFMNNYEKSIPFDRWVKRLKDVDDEDLKLYLLDAFNRYTIIEDPKEPNKRTFGICKLLEVVTKDDIYELTAYAFTEIIWWLFENKEDFLIENLLEET